MTRGNVVDELEAGATHGVVVILLLDGCEDPGGGGRLGNVLIELEEAVLIVPQERDCDTVDREDCAVDDFNFNTRVVFALVLPLDDDGVDEVVLAQFKGMEEDVRPLGPGRDG